MRCREDVPGMCKVPVARENMSHRKAERCKVSGAQISRKRWEPDQLLQATKWTFVFKNFKQEGSFKQICVLKNY